MAKAAGNMGEDASLGLCANVELVSKLESCNLRLDRALVIAYFS
jgi:hypothetical protein